MTTTLGSKSSGSSAATLSHEHESVKGRPNGVGSSHSQNTLENLLSNEKPPWGLKWRSHTVFIIATITIGMLSDMFIYAAVVPIMPFILLDRVHVPEDDLQRHTSAMLAVFAGATIVGSPPAGWLADKVNSRQLPFLVGLTALIVSTFMMLVGTSLPVLYIARVLQGASSAVVWTIGLALAIDTVGPENLGATMGTIFSFTTVGELAAPVLGGILYKKSGLVGVGIMCIGILVVDVLMRFLLIEKKTAAKYLSAQSPDSTDGSAHDEESQSGNGILGSQSSGDEQNRSESTQVDEENGHHSRANELTSLLKPTINEDDYHIPPDQPRFIRAVPILYCLKNPALLTAFGASFTLALLLGMWDATIPLQGRDFWDFDSLKSGLLFIPIVGVNFVGGPLSGLAVDRYGTKAVGFLGYLLLSPMLILLRIPQAEPRTKNIIIYCVILGLCGIFQTSGSAPSIVEAGFVVQRYHKRNPQFFGKNGPYASLYGLNTVFFSAGLTFGPIMAGGMRETIGYGNMALVFAAVTFLASIACLIWMGGTLRFLIRKPKDR